MRNYSEQLHYEEILHKVDRGDREGVGEGGRGGGEGREEKGGWEGAQRTRMAMLSSSRIPSKAPTSSHVMSGTVANPSRFAEGCTTLRATCMRGSHPVRSPPVRSPDTVQNIKHHKLKTNLQTLCQLLPALNSSISHNYI